MYFYQSVELFLHFLVFTCMNLESIHFCREHSNRNSISSCSNKLIFHTAATSFFSEMGFCLFLGSGRFLIAYHGENLNFCSKYWPTSVTVATKFPPVIPCNSCAYHLFSYPLGNKGMCHSCPFRH